jgi:hypothetical protein
MKYGNILRPLSTNKNNKTRTVLFMDTLGRSKNQKSATGRCGSFVWNGKINWEIKICIKSAYKNKNDYLCKNKTV